MSIYGPNYSDGLILIRNDLDMEGYRIKDLKNPMHAFDAVNKRYMNKRIEFKTKELEKKVDELAANTVKKTIDSDLDMRNHRIINIAHPRNPKDNPEYGHDAVTALYLDELYKFVEKNYLKKDVDGNLEMNGYRITGLSAPVDDNDAATKDYVHLRDGTVSNEFYHKTHTKVVALEKEIERIKMIRVM